MLLKFSVLVATSIRTAMRNAYTMSRPSSDRATARARAPSEIRPSLQLRILISLLCMGGARDIWDMNSAMSSSLPERRMTSPADIFTVLSLPIMRFP